MIVINNDCLTSTLVITILWHSLRRQGRKMYLFVPSDRSGIRIPFLYFLVQGSYLYYISSINAFLTFTSQVFSSCNFASFCVFLSFFGSFDQLEVKNNNLHLNRNNYLTYPSNIYLVDGLERVRIWEMPLSEKPIHIAWNLFHYAGLVLKVFILWPISGYSGNHTELAES